MTQQLREQEQLRKARRYDKWQKKEIQRAETAMTQNQYQIKCKRMPYCKKGNTKYCFYCTLNLTKPMQNPGQNYYQPKIPGIKIL